ncbi:MAG: hypothetical protein COB10_00355 [Planctomycetota bacterium]|nr:MAG: hypothetical protein COB10_00355 [Planctomycetota bacterium]
MTQANHPALEVADLIVIRGTHSIGPITFQLSIGKQLALTGGNGIGKSSMLLAIAGLLPVTSGTIRISGESMLSGSDGVEPWQRGISWLGQERGLWPHLSIEAQCRLVARDGGKTAEQIVAVAQSLDMAELIQRRPAALSGGEAQRAELLRTVSGGGALLLLDEPFSAQNEDGRRRIETLLEQECQAGRSVLLALHQTDSERETLTLTQN